MSEPLLLSFRAAAKLLGIGRGDSLNALIKSGLIRPVMLLGKLKIPREQVEELARAGEPPIEIRSPPRPKKRGSSASESVGSIDLDKL